jgi:hypothetical protein
MFLRLFKSFKQCINIRRNSNRGDVVKYNNRIRGYISFMAYLDLEMANKSQVSNLFIIGFI